MDFLKGSKLVSGHFNLFLITIASLVNCCNKYNECAYNLSDNSSCM